MKRKSKTTMAIAVLGCVALVYYGMAHSKMLTGGYYIYNQDAEHTYITENPTSCGDGSSIFPGKVLPKTLIESVNNKVTAGTLPAEGCHIDYKSEDGSKKCTISLQSAEGKITLSGTGDCKTNEAKTSVTLSDA